MQEPSPEPLQLAACDPAAEAVPPGAWQREQIREPGATSGEQRRRHQGQQLVLEHVWRKAKPAPGIQG
jgi:hypothetical protein